MTICRDNNICLRASDLRLSWDGRIVCEGISFEMRKSSILCLLGRSGSGKTTIFHALAGLTTPDAGKVVLDGKDITGRPGQVGYMLQKDLLFDERTILDNVCMPLRIAGVSKRKARAMASPLFEEFGIEGTQRLYPAQLSGGMRQRAALLRTYLMDDDVVLMDEPFSALDSMTRSDMRQWLLNMVSRLHLSVMLVTHDIDEAIFMADRILILSTPCDGPSTITASFEVDVGRGERGEYVFTQEALDLKKGILQALD